jgi:spore coat polysaccharide biosynthesis protein SpsF
MNQEMKFKTEQEIFWAGEFGDEYNQRNRGSALLASNLNFFTKALQASRNLTSCIEFGANIGMNLRAIQLLYPEIDLYAIEINQAATHELAQIVPEHQIHQGTILDFHADRTWDLVLIKGVLIHINPAELPGVYDKLAISTRRYVLVAEYYNPSPVGINYRGHSDRLFKRDFAGELMDRHPELKLLDYGFAYRRDPNFPQDDITWFLMEKG